MESANNFFSDHKFKMNFPKEVIFIKTTGKEDIAQAKAYCLKNTIIFNKSFIKPDIVGTFVHELFHIHSQNNPDKRKMYYESLGYELLPDHLIDQVELPDELLLHKLINPDAQCIDVVIKLKPIDFVEELTFVQVQSYCGFLYSTLISVVFNEEKKKYIPLQKNGKYITYNAHYLQEFIKKVGKNTSYNIHPEEICATQLEILYEDYIHNNKSLDGAISQRQCVNLDDYPSPKQMKDMITVLRDENIEHSPIRHKL
jgi:hypothetical protein